ncbi:peptidoglycan bridge formation glycyltransferase FemA/FemB family protein [Candidatus Saccharibacteria bacterium TM7i]|nr:peptidoglycan bridge formation glycyltransferase FemA/FemB family protein [Candidatus Saccharibacteria bacterium TM7i]
MTARFATSEEINNWNNLVSDSAGADTVFSTKEYAEIKQLTRYTPRYVIVDDLAVLVLEKRAWPFGSLWYLPKGPNVTSVEEFQSVMAGLEQLAKKSNVFFIRAESELPLADAPKLEALGYQKASPIIPSQSTITLDLTPVLDDIIATLPQKGRYAIRRAERDGVTVKQVPTTDENCKKMYNLLQGTAEGQFGIRSYVYYQAYWKTFADAHIGQLFFAYVDNKVVAGAFALYFNHKSTYKDGASIRERTAYGASHLLQWHVIQWAKERGATLHDFCGSPPSSEIHNEAHPHYKIGLFKTSFNKTVTDYIGCYDGVVSKTRYAIWSKIGERVHKKLYFQKTHDYYY